MRRRRWTRFTTTMQCSTAMQQNCTHGERNCFFPVNEEKDKGKEVEEERKDQEKEEEEEEVVEEEEEEITTTMQSSAAMQQSSTHGQGNCFFPSSEQGGGEGEGGGGGGDQNYNAVLRSNAAELYSSAKAIVSFQ